MRLMHTNPPNIARASQRGTTAATLLLVALVVLGCDKGRAPGAKRASAAPGSSPYADYLPKEPPVEKNRVAHPSGYSLISPPGWTMRIVSIEPFMKDYVADQFVLDGPQTDELKPVLTVQRQGPAGQRQWDAFAKPGAIIGDRYVRTTFRGETAFSKFLPGSGKSKSLRGAALSQQLVLKSAGQWFLLDFRMRNADDGERYYTQPLSIVQAYFESFRSKPAGG
jgi:hypothetical protein